MTAALRGMRTSKAILRPIAVEAYRGLQPEVVGAIMARRWS